MRYIIILTVITSIMTYHCSFFETKIALTHSHVENWISLMKKMGRHGPEFIQFISGNKNISIDEAQKQYKNINELINHNGFKDLKELQGVTLEIVKTLTFFSSVGFINKLELNTHKITQEFQKQISSSEKKSNNNGQTSNRTTWADMILKMTNSGISKENAEIVKSHLNELMQLPIFKSK